MVKVVLLNGVGSVGKSSIARALQNIVAQPFLHFEMDAFLDMMPERYLQHPDGLSFEKIIENGSVSTFAKTGSVAERVLSGMRHSAAAMALSGNNLIIDDVLYGNTDQGSRNAVLEYRNLLQPFNFLMIGVFASLKTLEKRELQRQDREVGLARWQFNRVHEGMVYDLTVDTDATSPHECAEIIKTRFDL